MPLSVSSNVRQLSDGNSNGTVLGQSATDKIAFYNGTPTVQLSGNAQAALIRGQPAGSLAIYATTQSPPAVTTSTTAEVTMTVMGATSAYTVAAGDVVILNKPTAQAGLGIGNVRISAANSIAVTFSNLTSATITPTAGQVYALAGIRTFNAITATLTPAVVGSFSTVEQTFSVVGLRVNELVQVVKPTAQAGLDIVGMRVAANNSLGITFMNVTAAAITPTAAEGYTIMSLGGIDAVSNTVLVQENVGVITGLGTTNSATNAEKAITMTGLTTQDTVVGVQKPTVQTGLGIVGARVSGSNSLGINFAALGVSITPTASEIYSISLFRPNPVAPLTIYQPTLTPAAVGSGTTAEQGFTVTGLASGTVVWVNKSSSATPGLGIVGCRVSGANVLAITFSNTTSAAITPPSEVYTVGNFNMPLGDNSSAWVQPLAYAEQAQSALANAARGAMVSLGLIAGA